jgi:hypothetical protein
MVVYTSKEQLLSNPRRGEGVRVLWISTFPLYLFEDNVKGHLCIQNMPMIACYVQVKKKD